MRFQIVFVIICCSCSVLGFHRSFRACRAHRHLICSTTTGFIDVSTAQDRTLLKTILRKGNLKQARPITKDSVEISWIIRDKDGVLIHDCRSRATTPPDGISKTTNTDCGETIVSFDPDDNFSFVVGASPRQVIQGWDIAVRTMFEGEKSLFIVDPSLGFGEAGAGPMIPGNTTLHCELELLKVTPAISRRFKSLGANESIQDELSDQIDRGESPIASAVMHKRNNINTGHSSSDIKVNDNSRFSQSNNAQSNTSVADYMNPHAQFFDPSKHKEDPSVRIEGSGRGHSWSESKYSIEIEVPLTSLYEDNRRVTKADVEVDVRSDYIRVGLCGEGALLQGPLQGRVNAQTMSWVLLDYDPVESYQNRAHQGVMLLLDKSHNSRDIWASVLNTSFLRGYANSTDCSAFG